MQTEIERKFFVKEMPNISGIEPLHYERYFLSRKKEAEERITRVGDSFIYEKKSEISNLERTQEKKIITEEEFNKLKQGASDAIIREGYNLSQSPRVSIKIYHGKYEGLVRAEVEFESEEEARSYKPLSWMGKEITDLPIARDSKLLDLSEEEFRRYIA